MNAGAVIYARLNGATSAGGRIYPLLMPEGPTYPAVTYQQISGTRLHSMGADASVQRVRVQVNAWGSTYAEARTLAGEIEGRLSRFMGTIGSTKVLDAILDNEIEQYENETQTRRVIQDFSLFLAPA